MSRCSTCFWRGVSVDTVKDHVAAVLKALGVASRTQAVLAATQKSRA